jgi:uncharacterized tellurite resistance protein B-like protein
MLHAIRQYFEKNIKPGQDARSDRGGHSLQVATAALLIEMMRMDTEILEQERQTILAALRTKFDLSREETDRLMELAESEAHQATDYYQFTSLINNGFTAEQKQRVVEYLWWVAYADGALDKHEEHLVRKIADLIHVPHRAFIVAKHRARAKMDRGTDGDT